MMPFLAPHQLEAVRKMKNGCILNGGVGTGKSRTGLFYYYTVCGGRVDINTGKKYPMLNPRDLYIITTAAKRDTPEWSGELCNYLISIGENKGFKVVVDSWNNIKKYSKVVSAFFIFDEDRVTGSGAWAKTFIDIARKNQWIILSATPGDCWMDYWAVFVANGFFKNKTDFTSKHVGYSRFCSYPKIDRYFGENILRKMRDSILVPMDMTRPAIPHDVDILCNFNSTEYNIVMKTSWNVFTNEPIKTAAECCYTLRKLVNSDPSRLNAIYDILSEKKKAIIFYSYDYELDILRSLSSITSVAERNGHKHQLIPNTDSWVYLVQYASGAEGWNCIETDTIIFYSMQYSYKTYMQARGRIDRMNTKHKDLYYYILRSDASIDRAIKKALNNKKDFNERRWRSKW
ncbi:MAG: hypothetical protein J6U54_01770 [Clostridiales bacterium]|nr:hypothetical protein [Clostridiales bacterium]